MDRAYPPVNSLLEQAACIVRKEKETTGNAEQTESYKRGQIKKLTEFADSYNLWISLSLLNIDFLSKGGENEVYADDGNLVIKLNNFEYAGEDLENFFIRIFAHNHYFSNVPYEMIGFAYNSQHEFCAVITQPYIIAKREATEDEIAEYMNAIGFVTDYQDEFHNKEYEIFDAVPNNVLYGIDNDLYFIDTQIRLRRI